MKLVWQNPAVRNTDLRLTIPDCKLHKGQKAISNYLILTNIKHNTSRLASKVKEELPWWQNLTYKAPSIFKNSKVSCCKELCD